jgi:hypothetical protein
MIDRSSENLLRNAGVNTDTCVITPLNGGNNRVFKIIADKGAYILKKYFFSKNDTRNRLETEFNFLMFLWENTIRNIPRPFTCDFSAHLGLYQYIEGEKPGKHPAGENEIIGAMEFMETINTSRMKKKALAQGSKIGTASDSARTLAGYVKGVDSRIKKISGIKIHDEISGQLSEFVVGKLVPAWEKIRNHILGLNNIDRVLPGSVLILSPSDFGFHNSVFHSSGRIFFIDFEYAGWDDPVKMVCDFFCQPEIPVPMDFFGWFIERTQKITESEYNVAKRAEALMPLFRIKWCCIMLNDFLKTGSQRRHYAFFDEDRRNLQMRKARIYFDNWLEHV